MKNLILAALALAFAAAPLVASGEDPSPPPASPTGQIPSPASTNAGRSSVTVLVPAGTMVPVHVVGTVSSGSAEKDKTFQIQAAQDVVIDDMVVIRKGAGGEGSIVEVDSAGGSGHSGSLGLRFSYVFSTDGGKISLSDATQKQAEEDRKGASSTATIIGFATFGLGGLFGHNLAHGRQKTIDEKTVMSAFVAENVHVQTAEHATVERYDK